MSVIVSYRGSSKAPSIVEEAESWTFGPLTVRLWGKNKDKPLAEFAMGEVAWLEDAKTPLKRYKGIGK